MIDRDEQDLRRDITSLRDSRLRGQSLAPMADAMQAAMHKITNPAPVVAPELEVKDEPKAEVKRGRK